jgi:hypothetical protein
MCIAWEQFRHDVRSYILTSEALDCNDIPLAGVVYKVEADVIIWCAHGTEVVEQLCSALLQFVELKQLWRHSIKVSVESGATPSAIDNGVQCGCDR